MAVFFYSGHTNSFCFLAGRQPPGFTPADQTRIFRLLRWDHARHVFLNRIWIQIMIVRIVDDWPEKWEEQISLPYLWILNCWKIAFMRNQVVNWGTSCKEHSELDGCSREKGFLCQRHDELWLGCSLAHLAQESRHGVTFFFLPPLTLKRPQIKTKVNSLRLNLQPLRAA